MYTKTKRKKIRITQEGHKKRVRVTDLFLTKEKEILVATFSSEQLCDDFFPSKEEGGLDSVVNPVSYSNCLTIHYKKLDITFKNISWNRAYRLAERQAWVGGRFFNRFYLFLGLLG